MKLTTEALEEVILGEAPSITDEGAARRLRVPREALQRLRVAAGLADAGEAPRFTAGDLDALRAMRTLLASGGIDTTEGLALARTLGRHMSRAAEAVAPVLAPTLASVQRRTAQNRLDSLDSVLLQLWRRHLLAAVLRHGDGEPGGEPICVAVGFADLVGYTATSRRLELAELEAVLEAFEARAVEVVAAAGGRIVKSLGDEVLFVADDAAASVEIALRLVGAVHTAEELTEVHCGVAMGPVLTWQGDVYGETVNVASRLTGLARPGTVLVHGDVAAGVAGDSRFELRPLRRLRLTRHGRWRPHAALWASGAQPPPV